MKENRNGLLFTWLYLAPYLTQTLFSPFGRDAAGREGYNFEIDNWV
jgi:hypothetical protein